MIISKIIGGLGNQMFQYAAARRVAHFNNTQLKLDITGYKNQTNMTKREYMLHVFNIRQDIASLDEIKSFKKKIPFFSRFIPYDKQSYIREKHSYFCPDILKILGNKYLDGYWASEKYFKDIEDIIRKDFSFKYQMDSRNKRMSEKINSTNSISIHIRRGDYVSDTKTNKTHGVCSLTYYRRAVSYITKKITNPSFFLFSDDINWIKENLKLNYPAQYIDFNRNEKSYEDMRLMSLCKHNIIANSTFSWWGAWLNRNKNKIVIAPKNWFKDKSINTRDLIPNSWLQI